MHTPSSIGTCRQFGIKGWKLLRSARNCHGHVRCAAVYDLAASLAVTLLPWNSSQRGVWVGVPPQNACRCQATGTDASGGVAAAAMEPSPIRKPVSWPAKQLSPVNPQPACTRLACCVNEASLQRHTKALSRPCPALCMCVLQVVTAIIRRESDGKLLLVKRSDQVMQLAAHAELVAPSMAQEHTPCVQSSCPVLQSCRRTEHVPALKWPGMYVCYNLEVWSDPVHTHCLPWCPAQVGSYQQYWGGVSGGVEGNESLLHRALQEVNEPCCSCWVRPTLVASLLTPCQHQHMRSVRARCHACVTTLQRVAFAHNCWPNFVGIFNPPVHSNHCAAVQISEEVGLTPQQLQLVTCGRPLPVDDERRHFLIYPFLFSLVDASATVTLNWENVAYDWVAPR